METPSDKPGSWLHFGTSSFSSKDWVGPFYPPATRPADFLKYYATQFDTVEIDSTYYAIPTADTVTGWRDKTPESFTFAAKFPAAIVFGGESPRPDPQILLQPDQTYALRDLFLARMNLLGKRLGPLVLQFPYFRKEEISAAVFMERLDRFLQDLPAGFQYTIEIRNRHWLKEDFAELCRKHHCALALTDIAGMPLADEIEKQFDPVTANFTFIRLLGNRQAIERITTKWDQEVVDQSTHLLRWAGFLQRQIKRRTMTFIYVNNHYAGHAPSTLRKLMGMVSDDMVQRKPKA